MLHEVSAEIEFYNSRMVVCATSENKVSQIAIKFDTNALRYERIDFISSQVHKNL